MAVLATGEAKAHLYRLMDQAAESRQPVVCARLTDGKRAWMQRFKIG